MSTILCVDDEPSIGVVVEAALGKIGHSAILAGSVEEAIKEVRERAPDLIIADYQMPGGTGVDLIDLLKREKVDIPVIIMTGYASVENAVSSMRRGAVDYLTKPIRFETLRIAVNNALELCRLRRENEHYRGEIVSLRECSRIIGDSQAWRSVLETVQAVAPTAAAVLLEGESGTGKELLARLVHRLSPRADRPFVAINCAALPEGLVESTLFGHERGAFTGAMARAVGAFERADGGTLLLDEVAEMRQDLQAKLLRAIQEREIHRVGGGQTIPVDVRIIATSNRCLATEVDGGRFRQDLYYRLSVVPIRTPALRERPEDIPGLVQHFVETTARGIGIETPVVPEETMRMLCSSQWPGNVRELSNVIERALILSRGRPLDPGCFEVPGPMRAAPPPTPGSPGAVGEPASSTEVFDLKEIEMQTIRRALESTGGNRSRAARMLGISERTLRNKLNHPAAV